MSNPQQNIDTEIWRQDSKDPLDPDNLYSPSIYVTTANKIGIRYKGVGIELTIEQWLAGARLFGVMPGEITYFTEPENKLLK